MFVDQINSILCSCEMCLFDAVLMFTTAVLLAAIPCQIFQRQKF